MRQGVITPRQSAPPLQDIAAGLAAHGRYGDTELLHVNRAELEMLESMSPGGLTINPVTGQKEAFLPFLIPLFASFLPGMLGLSGTSALLAGAAASGLGTWAATGDFKKGLTSGLLGFGLGSLGSLASGAKGMTAAANAAKTAKTAASVGSGLAKGADMASKIAYGQQGLASMAGMGASAPGVMANAAPALTNAATNTAARAAQNGMMSPSMMAKLGEQRGFMSGIANSPAAQGMRTIMTNPVGALKTAASHPFRVGLPLAASAYLGMQPGQMEQIMGSSSSTGAPKDRPSGGYQPRPRTVTPYGGDYTRYGEVPGEHMFFTEQPPTTYTPPSMPGGILPMQPIQLAGGGIARGMGSRPVRGPGGPTEDKIPALLSNGEYVFSAKAVKNMGSGSTERGFKALDALHRRARKKPIKMANGGAVEGISKRTSNVEYTSPGAPIAEPVAPRVRISSDGFRVEPSPPATERLAPPTIATRERPPKTRQRRGLRGSSLDNADELLSRIVPRADILTAPYDAHPQAVISRNNKGVLAFRAPTEDNPYPVYIDVVRIPKGITTRAQEGYTLPPLGNAQAVVARERRRQRRDRDAEREGAISRFNLFLDRLIGTEE